MITLTLPSNLGIESACTLHQQLMGYLHQSAPVQVDASHISRIHSASIQVLCAWVSARRQREYETLFSPISPVLTEAAHLLGVAHCLLLTTPSSALTVEKNK